MHQLSLCNFVSPWWPWSLTLLTVVAATDSTILRTTRTCASCSCALLYNFIIQLFQNSLCECDIYNIMSQNGAGSHSSLGGPHNSLSEFLSIAVALTPALRKKSISTGSSGVFTWSSRITWFRSWTFLLAGLMTTLDTFIGTVLRMMVRLVLWQPSYQLTTGFFPKGSS